MNCKSGILASRLLNKQPIIALYFESENEIKFYNLKAKIQPHDAFAEINLSLHLFQVRLL